MSYFIYDDLASTSPSGLLRIQIRSPDNHRGNAVPVEQSNFTYQVVHTLTEETIWQTTPGKRSAMNRPCSAWINDEGFVVVRTGRGHSSLHLFEPTGREVFSLEVTQKLLNCEDWEWQPSSCGPNWHRGGAAVFFETEDGSFWLFRTATDRELLLDLTRGALADPDACRDKIRLAQNSFAIDAISEWAQRPELFARVNGISEQTENLLEEIDPYRLLPVAIRWSGMNGVVSARPSLFQLESSNRFSSSSHGWPTPNANKTWCTRLMISQSAQLALRRLGVIPRGLASYQLWNYEWSDEIGPRFIDQISVPECLNDRRERLKRLKPGLTFHEVTQSVGMPDFDWGLWDYDVLDELDEPCTYRLLFDKPKHSNARLAEIVVFPPQWIQSHRRELW